MRDRPDDFEAIFVRIGRVACQEYYRARRKTITRWIEELGKERLINLRAEFVRAWFIANRASTARIRKLRTVPVTDFRFVHPKVLAAAIDWLGKHYKGGWKVTATGAGDWWIGLQRSSSAQVVDLAERYGFDRAAADLTVKAGRGVGSGQ